MIHETVRKFVPVAIVEPPSRCASGCQHYDAITCIAREKHMSRFNAMLTFGTGDIDKYPGACTCPCHRDKQNHQVSESEWRARVRRQAVARKHDKAVRA